MLTWCLWDLVEHGPQLSSLALEALSLLLLDAGKVNPYADVSECDFLPPLWCSKSTSTHCKTSCHSISCAGVLSSHFLKTYLLADSLPQGPQGTSWLTAN